MKNIYSAYLATIVSLLYITGFTIFADVKYDVFLYIAKNFYHHWVFKGVTSTILWLLVYFVFIKISRKPDLKFFNLVFFFCSFQIILFFIYFYTIH